MDKALPIERICNKCKRLRPIEHFIKKKDRYTTYFGNCKDCHRDYIHDMRAGWSEERKLLEKEKLRIKNERSRAALRVSHLKHIYGITVDDYNRMLSEQGGLCAICRGPEVYKNRNLSVDHCHTTKKVRGLLCRRCNLSIGQFKDNPDLLEKASNYLRRSYAAS